MNPDIETPDLFDQGWYLSHMYYYATGEGVTLCIAIGGSHSYAENVLKERIDKYFYRAIETSAIDKEMRKNPSVILQMIPDEVKEKFRKFPLGAGYYFSELHYNLA